MELTKENINSKGNKKLSVMETMMKKMKQNIKREKGFRNRKGYSPSEMNSQHKSN